MALMVQVELVRQLSSLTAGSLFVLSALVFISWGSRRCLLWQMLQDFFNIHWAAWCVFAQCQQCLLVSNHTWTTLWIALLHHYTDWGNDLCFHSRHSRLHPRGGAGLCWAPCPFVSCRLERSTWKAEQCMWENEVTEEARLEKDMRLACYKM